MSRREPGRNRRSRAGGWDGDADAAGAGADADDGAGDGAGAVARRGAAGDAGAGAGFCSTVRGVITRVGFADFRANASNPPAGVAGSAAAGGWARAAGGLAKVWAARWGGRKVGRMAG
ncbi:MAG: hypothetical protein ACK5YG_10455 [Alphaproteobacteria bacterium]